MKKLSGLFVLACCTTFALATTSARYRHHGVVLLNDLSATPGAVRTTNEKDVCNERTPQFRNTTEKMKNEVYAEYGVERDKGICAGGCEVDHLISLEIGGADVVANLWPQPSQPVPGFHQKDVLENYLHKQVCDGGMPLRDAQQGIARDWYAMYKVMLSRQGAK